MFAIIFSDFAIFLHVVWKVVDTDSMMKQLLDQFWDDMKPAYESCTCIWWVITQSHQRENFTQIITVQQYQEASNYCSVWFTEVEGIRVSLLFSPLYYDKYNRVPQVKIFRVTECGSVWFYKSLSALQVSSRADLWLSRLKYHSRQLCNDLRHIAK